MFLTTMYHSGESLKKPPLEESSQSTDLAKLGWVRHPKTEKASSSEHWTSLAFRQTQDPRLALPELPRALPFTRSTVNSARKVYR